ncbi:MAG TPA: hypothetical protein VNM87_06765, partial [Candidatus Udaeobacter sp.]|nr:hypothetical protein [Candidatus Udaeobacter sp.]
LAGGSGLPAPPALLSHPPGFFHLAYCGSGRKNDPAGKLHSFDWNAAAEGFELTIVQEVMADYRDFIASTRRQAPEHRFGYYLHAHGVYSYDDMAGVLNLIERNFVHATDPASLRVVPVADGLLVDWDWDERPRYDEYDTISPMRDFQVLGYVVYRSVEGGEFTIVWPRVAKANPAHLAAADSITPGAGEGVTADTTLTAEILQRTEFVDQDVAKGKHYRYVVRTIGALDREYPYSGEVTAVAGEPAAELVPHDHQCVVEGAPADSVYTGRFRIRLPELRGRVRLLIDRNADHDFADPDETAAMKPSGEEDWVEAVVKLAAKSHSELDVDVKFGFGYRIEVEGEKGQKITLPPTWVYTTNVTNRLRDANWGFYWTRADSPYWIEYVSKLIDFTGARPNGQVKSVFFDELLFDPAARVDALPADLTAERGIVDAATLVAAIHAQRPDLALYYNGLPRDPLTPLWQAVHGNQSTPADTLAAAGATGGMIEGFAVSSWYDSGHGNRARNFAPPEEWFSQIACARAEAERGSELLLLARGPSLTETRERIFAFASYLLVRAPGVRFGYMVDRCTTPPLPEWGADLGAADEPIPPIGRSGWAGEDDGRNQVGGAYGRRFERGEVWVNPGERREVVKLDLPGYRLGIAPDSTATGKVRWNWVTQLELEPQSAAIVVRSAPPAPRG